MSCAHAIRRVLAIAIFYVVAGWKVFAKAGEPGWGVFVPIYNLYLVCKISGRPEWWLILFFIPLVNIVIGVLNASCAGDTNLSVMAN